MIKLLHITRWKPYLTNRFCRVELDLNLLSKIISKSILIIFIRSIVLLAIGLIANI